MTSEKIIEKPHVELKNLFTWMELFSEIEMPDRGPNIPAQSRYLDAFKAEMKDSILYLTITGKDSPEQYLEILSKHYDLTGTLEGSVIAIDPSKQTDIAKSIESLTSTVCVNMIRAEVNSISSNVDRILDVYSALGRKITPETLEEIVLKVQANIHVRIEQLKAQAVEQFKKEVANLPTTHGVEAAETTGRIQEAPEKERE